LTSPSGIRVAVIVVLGGVSAAVMLVTVVAIIISDVGRRRRAQLVDQIAPTRRATRPLKRRWV